MKIYPITDQTCVSDLTELFGIFRSKYNQWKYQLEYEELIGFVEECINRRDPKYLQLVLNYITELHQNSKKNVLQIQKRNTIEFYLRNPNIEDLRNIMFKDLTEFLYIGFEFNLRFNHVFLD